MASEELTEIRSPDNFDPQRMDASLMHLQHMFEGYRHRMRHTDATFDPAGGYSPGSARRESWDLGVAMAEADLAFRDGSNRLASA